ncbi:MAG: hypothetical protein LBU64_13885 [Planctomycetota bacterium]|jgi:hypothetical protein|nr:hypothetical protein [Planctomycetota bacterium]
MGRGRGKAKTGAAAIEAAERQARALDLRRQGYSFEAVAAACGYADRACAYKAVMAGLNRTLREPADELRQLEGERLDALLATVYPAAAAGDLAAVAAVLRIGERRARLFGLDRREAPVKVANLPKLEKAADALAVVAGLLEKAGAGELSPDEAGKLAGLAGAFVKLSESVDLEARVAALEERHGS